MEISKKPELADIFRRYKDNYIQKHKPTDYQIGIIESIINCRSSVFGSHANVCMSCGGIHIAFNSCRNRHCPKCQFRKKEKWLFERKQESLPVKYFHIVFTLPHILNTIALCNKKAFYTILFKAVFFTISKFGYDNRWLGAATGGIGILHTWGQNLSFHPHIHLIVPSGGLSEDKTEWLKTHPKFFAPVRSMSIVYRNYFIKLLKKEMLKEDFNKPKEIDNQLKEARRKKWVVFAQKPFSCPDRVIDYLGNYTHKVALSNSRIIKSEDGKIYFSAKDYNNKGTSKQICLEACEFIRRFMLHVLPRNFYKIRYFGFMSNRNRKENLLLALRALRDLNIKKCVISDDSVDLSENLKSLNANFGKCPDCGGQLIPLSWAKYIVQDKFNDDS